MHFRSSLVNMGRSMLTLIKHLGQRIGRIWRIRSRCLADAAHIEIAHYDLLAAILDDEEQAIGPTHVQAFV